MNILLLGCGFIGRFVLLEALSAGHTVTVADIVVPAADILSLPNTQHVQLDVCNTQDVVALLHQHDCVINLAAILGTSETLSDPLSVLDANLRAPLKVFDALRLDCERGRSTKFVQITVGNYFMNNPYAISKSTLERYALMYNTEFGTDITLVRALNAYGPYQKTGPVRKIMPTFIQSALKGEPLPIYGTGNQIMDMIYVTDVAKVLCAAATCGTRTPDVLEAGTGRRTTVNDIAAVVLELTASTAGVRHLPMRPGEPVDSTVLGDPNTLMPIGMGDHNFVELAQGVRESVAWYREKLGIRL